MRVTQVQVVKEEFLFARDWEVFQFILFMQRLLKKNKVIGGHLV